MTWLAVATGGALGSAARHAMNLAVGRLTTDGTPYATAGVNIIGSALIGVLAGLIATGRWQPTIAVRAFVFVGLIGGFTTFSSLTLDTLVLAHQGKATTAAINIVGQLIAGVLAVVLGYAAGSSSFFSRG